MPRTLTAKSIINSATRTDSNRLSHLCCTPAGLYLSHTCTLLPSLLTCPAPVRPRCRGERGGLCRCRRRPRRSLVTYFRASVFHCALSLASSFVVDINYRPQPLKHARPHTAYCRRCCCCCICQEQRPEIPVMSVFALVLRADVRPTLGNFNASLSLSALFTVLWYFR